MRLYAIVDRETCEVVRDKAYVNIRDAKLALKYHYVRRTQKYGIGYVERSAKLAWVLDENGNWTEIPKEEVGGTSPAGLIQRKDFVELYEIIRDLWTGGDPDFSEVEGLLKRNGFALDADADIVDLTEVSAE